jgi:hypothetical protein
MRRQLECAPVGDAVELPKEFTSHTAFSDRAIKALRAQAFAYAEECKKTGQDVKVTVRWNTFTAPGKGIVQVPTYTVKSK